MRMGATDPPRSINLQACRLPLPPRGHWPAGRAAHDPERGVVWGSIIGVGSSRREEGPGGRHGPRGGS
jgi:hypothetical protein